ncbi:MAG: hypothetical protein LBC94_03245 [Desulfovibrio sp.]|nr:hypothetical protein [Desulfovibrio sp.]
MKTGLGWEHIRNFARDIPLPTKGAVREHKERLKSNLEREGEYRSAGFEKVLEGWGIESDADIAYAIKAKKVKMFCGMAIAALFLGYWAYDLLFASKSLFWRSMDGFACLSFACAGLVAAVEAIWRIRILKNRRFVPFLVWLTTFGGLRREAGTA